MNRREFFQAATAAAFISSLGRAAALAQTPGAMPYRVLGRTGEKVSLLGLGGWHIGLPWLQEADAISIVRTAIDNGVNFLDNSWDYNNGESERRMGKALLDGYRAKAFLMTKLDGRTAPAASAQLDESLQRLQVDHIDLIQVHEVLRLGDADRIFGPGGAMETLIKARTAGKVRYIGFTGHKSPEIHLHMLDTAEKHGFAFDTVQMPLNVMDAHFSSFGHNVLPVVISKNMGVLGMKSMGSSIILRSQTASPQDCLNFAMNLPVSVCIAGCDSMQILQQGLDAARNFRPLTEAEVAAILVKTETAAADGQYEPYKTTDRFDTTTRIPAVMG